MKYGPDFGCRYRNIPHDLKIVHETKAAKWEVCQICYKPFRWNKGYKGRIDNNGYLKAHVRNLAQPNGPTRHVYNQIYKPHKNIIRV